MTLHVSDFDGVDERHWMPGKGIVDWNDVIAALVEVGYEGPFTLNSPTKTQRRHTILKMLNVGKGLGAYKASNSYFAR